MTAACARFGASRCLVRLTGAVQGRRLVFPEILEPIWCQSGVPDGGHDRTVPEIGLDGASVVAQLLGVSRARGGASLLRRLLVERFIFGNC
jgi:hypothetical protein